MTVTGDELVKTLIAFIVGGGLTALVGTLIKGVSALRSGVRAEEREAIAEVGKSRRDAIARARAAEIDAWFWSGVAARYARQLIEAGVEPVPPDPVPPSERAGTGHKPNRQGK